MTRQRWHPICGANDVVPDRGVASLVESGSQQPLMVALFRLASVSHEHSAEWFAVDHLDPVSLAPVMARGLVGSEGSTPTVSSPINKRRYDLSTGLAMDGESPSLRSWPVRVVNGRVQICTNAEAQLENAMA